MMRFGNADNGKVQRYDSRKPRGLTLVEIMMVIAIMGIVAAMVVPTLGNTAMTKLQSAASLIVADAARHLAVMVVTVADKLRMDEADYVLALAGGVLVHNRLVSDSVMQWLAREAREPGTCRVVAEPVAGSVVLARGQRDGPVVGT